MNPLEPNTPEAVDSQKTRPSEYRKGFILLAVGVWLLINTLNLFGLDYGRSWPLLLIFIGTATMLAPNAEECGRTPHPGLFMIVWGSLAWLAVSGMWGFSWRTIWPLFLVGAGFLIALTAIGDQRRRYRSSRGKDTQ